MKRWMIVAAMASTMAVTASCSNTTDGTSGNGGVFTAGGALNAQSSAQPVEMNDLLGAWVPEMCGHDADYLVGGEVPGLSPSSGFVFISQSLVGGKPDEYQAAFGDLNGDGVQDGAMAVICSAGGVGWPANIELYTDGETWLGGVDLGDLPGGGGRGAVDDIYIADGEVHVDWTGYDENGGGANTNLPMTATLMWDGQQVVVEDVHEQ